MFKTIYLSTVVLVLILSGIWHIAAPSLTERWISRANGIRLFGALLLELSIPCVWWGGWYYWVLFGGLTISGLLRLCFPQSSLRTVFPNRVSPAESVAIEVLAFGATIVELAKLLPV